jgi:histidyl-tRNA synthetase
MAERKMFPPAVEQASADILLTLFDQASIPDVLKLAGDLRARGTRVEVYPEPDKLGKQMKYASTRRIPFAAILGSDEIARGEVTIKNLGSGAQESVPREAVADRIRGSSA